MWKHELSNGFVFSSKNPNDEFVNRLGALLNGAIVFFCGEVENVHNIINIKAIEETLITGKFKIPYQNVLFEFNDNGTRIALHLANYEDYTRMSTFISRKDYFSGGWYLSSVILDINNEDHTSRFGYISDINDELNESGEKMVKIYFTILNQVLLLLHCKNIVKKENKPPEKLNKKRIKNGKLPLFSYYTLHIKDSINSNSKNVLGDHNRIHLCRGHFKHYTKENPLFGKLTGMYWWQPHVRGQNKDGIIMKDYVVKCA